MDPHWFKHAKQIVINTIGLDQDALHIYIGLSVLLAAGWVLRRPLGSLLPLIMVLAVALAGECYDLRFYLDTQRRLMWQESLHDVLNTLFWPLVLVLLARRRLL